MKRFLCLLLGAAFFAVSLFPVSAQAAEDLHTWVELLETATVNDSGSNLVTFSGISSTVRIKTPQYMRLTKVDMVLTHPAGSAPTSIQISYNGSLYNLKRSSLDSYTTRFYGDNIPNALYADLVIVITKSGTANTHYQFLTCKVSSLESTDFPASASFKLGSNTIETPGDFTLPSNFDDPINFTHFQFPLIITDWQKFDKLIISGSLNQMALNSVRCTIDGLGLPFEISYTQSNASGSNTEEWNQSTTKYYSYDESYKTSGQTTSYTYTEYTGKTLFTITVDLSAVDRSSTQDLYVYFTCLSSTYWGYTVQFLGVIGSVAIADTTNASTWDKVKAFFTDLFASDSSEAEDFGSNMESQAGEMQDAVDEMDQVTKPNVDDLDVSLDQYMGAVGMAPVNDVLGAIFENEIIVTMLIICLTCAFASYALFGKR